MTLLTLVFKSGGGEHMSIDYCEDKTDYVGGTYLALRTVNRSLMIDIMDGK